MRDALALVPDLDHHRLGCPRSPDGDRARPVDQRVVEQGGDHLAQRPGRDVGGQALLPRHLQLAVGPAERRVPLDHLLGDHVVDGQQRRHAAGRPPGPAQQLADHLGEPLGLGQGRRAFLPDHVGVPGGGDHLLQPHRQRGQRGAQLMGGVRGEVTLGGQQVGDAPRRAVQPFGQPVQLGHPVPAAQRARVTQAEPVGRAGEFLQRPGQPPRLQDGQRHRHRHRGQGQRADQREGGGQPAVLDRVVGGHGHPEVLGHRLPDDGAPRLGPVPDGELRLPVLPDADVAVRQRVGRGGDLRHRGGQPGVHPVLQRLGHGGRVPLHLPVRGADLQPAEHEGQRQTQQQNGRHRHHERGDEQAAAHGSVTDPAEVVSPLARNGSPRRGPW